VAEFSLRALAPVTSNESCEWSEYGIFRLVALEDALPPEYGIDDGPLYRAALAVEQDRELAAEMAEWEVAT
jgi:hypothetical protein